MTELKLLVKDCDYANSDEMVRDRIVFTTNSPKVHEKLLVSDHICVHMS